MGEGYDEAGILLYVDWRSHEGIHAHIDCSLPQLRMNCGEHRGRDYCKLFCDSLLLPLLWTDSNDDVDGNRSS